MIVIGIDPGLARVGYGVIAVNNRNPNRSVTAASKLR